MTLDDYKKQVHAKGFNISMLINKFKKNLRQRKALYEVPDDVLIEVCKDFLQYADDIKDPWPYFLKVLHMKSSLYNAHCRIEESRAIKDAKMPQRMKDIMRSL